MKYNIKIILFFYFKGKIHFSGFVAFPTFYQWRFLKRSINFMECISKVDIRVFTITSIYRKIPNRNIANAKYIFFPAIFIERDSIS